MVSNKEKNFISAVVYLHNNEDHIQYFLKNLHTVLSENFEKYEVICVNDHSTDRTMERVREMAAGMSQSMMSIINMSFYQGLEQSMNAGIDLAIGDFVYEFDSLFMDYEVGTIMEAYRTSLKGFDIVSVTSGKSQRMFSKLFYQLFNGNANNPYKLDSESFKVVSRRAINRVNAMSNSIPYRKAMYANSGLKLERIYYNPIKECRSTDSRQIMDSRKKLATDSIILFTDVAYKFSVTMTLVMMIMAFAVGIYAVVIFLGKNPVEGWTTTMLFLAFGFFGVFAVMAIIIKYLSILIDMTFKRQRYTIESIEKITG
jgi:dolichol-phosphate mannosyltransferase